MAQIIINESQLKVIVSELKKNDKNNILTEAEWYNLVGDIVGIFDPTGIVDIVNGISYFSQGDHLFGLLSLISAIPYAGDVVAKPVMGALKIGSTAGKELKVALDLAKVGKTAEASASLAKLAKEPGVIGKFLQGAKGWAPKVAETVERLPGGPLKGFKNMILDYLKLLENAGAKSVEFQAKAGNLSKYIGLAAKPEKNIMALQAMLKNDKIFTDLSKTGTLSNIFLGGAPRLFGNRRLRILMRQTKFWLGFLDFVGLGNFVGPEEIASKLGGEENVKKKMEEYTKTPQAQQYAKEDFAEQEGTIPQIPSTSQQQSKSTSTSGGNGIEHLIKGIFSSQLGRGIVAAL
jgi:hypothetical protein